MPFRKWTVEPVHLARNPQPPDKVLPDFEFEHVINGSLVKCIQQLGSILHYADKIFDEIGSECRLVYERAERINTRIVACRDLAVELNARAVTVPVSDLNTTKKFLRENKPYKTVYEQSTQLFLPSNRPPCIDQLYNQACSSPVSVICTIDNLRTDGCTSSQLFMVTPILGGDRKKKKRMLDIETRKPAKFLLATCSEDSDCNVDGGVVSPSIGLNGKSIERLPSPEELTLAASLEYPSTVVPVDTSGNSFTRMILSRRSLIHADFEIRRKKGKHKSKRRHTVCEGNNKDIEEAIKKITMTNNSCQTDEPQEPTSSSSLFSFRRSFSRRRRASDVARRETVALDGLDLDLTRKDSDLTLSSQDQNKKETQTVQSKKSSKGSLMSRAAKINPISSLSAAISNAVKMRHSKSSGKQDDGRSSSGNWSASSSARASLDSDQHHAVMLAVERNSNLSRNSVGKDSVLSDATTVTANLNQHETARTQEQSSGRASNERNRFSNSKWKSAKTNPLWDYDHSRDSNASTPERTSDCASTPLVMSPYTNRRNRYVPNALDDGDSSVYSVDTDGYYTSMHTDSGLWNTLNNVKNGDNQTDSIKGRHRQESQSSVSTIGNGSINSFLSKIVTETENSSTCSSLKQQKPAPDPPPRFSSTAAAEDLSAETSPEVEIKPDEVFEKENTPPKNGSASESDYESRDRIRVKTTINSSRYPSLCAVSPETSDDELGDGDKSKTLTRFVVAEVHREDTQEEKVKETEDSGQALNAHKTPRTINMYGSNSPTEATFSSSLLSKDKATTSTPKHKSLTSFISDSSDAVKVQHGESPSLVQKLLSDLKKIPSPIKDFSASNQPANVPKTTTPRDAEGNLIPLKYAQRITVTPIVRYESVDNSRASTPASRSKSFLKNPLSTLSFRNSESVNSKPKSPSYVSFQSPDSPVSSSTSLTPDVAPHDTPTLKKAVARVTLDPTGKVIYSSSSLERNKTENMNTSQSESGFSTFPKSYAPPRNVAREYQNSIPRMAAQESRNAKTVSSQILENKTGSYRLRQGENTPQSPSQSQNLLFRPSRGGRLCRTYFPSHIIATSPTTPSYSHHTPTNVSPSYPHHTPPPNLSPSMPSPNHYNVGKTPQRQNSINSPTRTYSQSPSYSNSSSLPLNGNLYPTSPVHQRNSNQSLTDRYGRTTMSNADSVVNSEINANYSRPVHTMPKDYGFRPVTPSQDAIKAYSNTSTSPAFKRESLSRSPSIKSNVTSTASSPLLSAYPYQKMESNNKISELPLSNPPDVIPSSSTPPSTLDITARTVRKEGGFLSTAGKPAADPSNLKSLSSSELFAIIHNSKKKHNIRTESEKSLSPMSSRSSSPSLSGLSPAKTMKIETGVLGRPGTASPTVEGNTSTIDRLGRTKPTSMHDFKMLLLQTRVGGTDPSPRPSAAELLKVSPTKEAGLSPSKTLPRTPPSSSPIPKYPQTSQYSNHSTIPVKRGARTRSPFLTRYDSTYPPIWEDCSEDLEAADENQNTVNSFTHAPSRDSYLSKKTALDNEKSNSRATTTWV